VVAVLPEAREGGEDEVHEAVEVGHVEGEDLHDYLGAEELEGPDQGDSEGLGDGAFGVVVFCEECFVSGGFDELFLLAMKKNGSICFLQEEEA
jgi:hypothetical protein